MALLNSSSHLPPAKGAEPAAKPKAEQPDAIFLNAARVRGMRLRFHMRAGQQLEGAVRTFGTWGRAK